METDALLLKQYTEARDALRSNNTEDVEHALDLFLSLGDYKNSAVMAEKCKMLLDFQPGSTVTFGSYEGKPIRWHVCDSNGKMRMLIAEDVVFNMSYNTHRLDVSWQTASLRKWLNSEFLKLAFTPEERMLAIATRRSNEPNDQFFTNAGLPTMDKVFVLSNAELDRYLPDMEDRALGTWWWLRTPGDNLRSVEAVEADGTIYFHGVNSNYENGGVRPAMWLLMKNY